MRRHSKSWRIRVPTHTEGECDKRTSSDGCQTLTNPPVDARVFGRPPTTLLQCCGRQPLLQRVTARSHTASTRRWPFVALTRQRTTAYSSSFRITDMMCVWTCNGGEGRMRSGRNGRNGGSRGDRGRMGWEGRRRRRMATGCIGLGWFDGLMTGRVRGKRRTG
jgi:hypothetical protein